jgi:hypothetical protein
MLPHMPEDMHINRDDKVVLNHAPYPNVVELDVA